MPNGKGVYLPYANLVQKSVITCPFFIKGALWSFGLVFGQDRVVQFFEWLCGGKDSLNFPEPEPEPYTIEVRDIKHVEDQLQSLTNDINGASKFPIVIQDMIYSIKDRNDTIPVEPVEVDQMPQASRMDDPADAPANFFNYICTHIFKAAKAALAIGQGDGYETE
ncbi:hypothetical protein Cyrtocomes_00573 [Candidatus Cyrtobacter comes]|uniref:Uncharacterized protein n=1 Tax=Candidatus Cyrtobacter comes TaxID=675776 RepID=A0ABU5L8F9_9RICK|nr:hypothetical protein [Candidatus Cyrtobacter comes]